MAVQIKPSIGGSIGLPKRSPTPEPNSEITHKSPPPNVDLAEATSHDVKRVSEGFEATSDRKRVAERLGTEIDSGPRTETASEANGPAVSLLAARLLGKGNPGAPLTEKAVVADIKTRLRARKKSVQSLTKEVAFFAGTSLRPEIKLKQKTVKTLGQQKRTLEKQIDKTKGKQERNRIFAALLGGMDGMLILDAYSGSEDKLAALRSDRDGLASKAAAVEQTLAPVQAAHETLAAELAALKHDATDLAPINNGWFRSAPKAIDQLGHQVQVLDKVVGNLERQVVALRKLATVEQKLSGTLDTLIGALGREIDSLKGQLEAAEKSLFVAAVDVVAAAGSAPGDALIGDFPLEARTLTDDASSALAAKVLAVADRALGNAPDALRQRVVDKLNALL